MSVRCNWLKIVPTGAVLMFALSATAPAANITSIGVGMVISGEVKAGMSARRGPPRYTCGAARVKISLAGYRDIQTLKCSGNIYVFGVRFNSQTSNIGFNALTGRIALL